MSLSIRSMVQEDMQCEDLLECMYGLGRLDRQVFDAIVDASEPLSVDELADRVDRERSTVYRACRRLADTGFVEKEQRNYDDGGYYFVYGPAGGDGPADELQRILNEWYTSTSDLIEEFRETYADAQPDPGATDRLAAND